MGNLLRRGSGLRVATLLALIITNPVLGQPTEPMAEPEAATDAVEETVMLPYEKEIHGLHDFFQQWFRGELPNTDESFARFTGVMSDSMVHINPGGTASEHDALVEAIHQGYGGWVGRSKKWEIQIENIQLRQDRGDVLVVTYEEWQFLGQQTRARLSTVVFGKKEGTPNGLEWLHVHEVWMPQE